MFQNMQAGREVASILNTTWRQVVGHASKASSPRPFLLHLETLLMSAARHVPCCLPVMLLRLHLYQELLALLQIKSAVKMSVSSFSHRTW